METVHNKESGITDEERDILQEIMNIAFGKASADLAEFIDIYVTLNIPEIDVVQADNLHKYLQGDINSFGSIHLVEQTFWGKFKGKALLVFPSDAGKGLVSILDAEEVDLSALENASELESQTVTEVGNIIIGACVGKVAELLEDVVTYSPPHVLIATDANKEIYKGKYDKDSLAIIMKTMFSFQERDVEGYLFLVLSPDSVPWLKKALYSFLEQYD